MKVSVSGHVYEVPNELGGTQTIRFVEKTPKNYPKDKTLKVMHNGTSTEEVLKVLIDRTEALDRAIPSKHNKVAIKGLNSALKAFEDRTAAREKLGIKGVFEEEKEGKKESESKDSEETAPDKE